MIIPQRVQIILIIHFDVPHTSTKLADFTKAPREAVTIRRERGIKCCSGRHVCYIVEGRDEQGRRLLALRREGACADINQ